MLIALLLQFQGNALGEVAYWSFQNNPEGTSFSTEVSLSTFPDGTPVLSGTGSSLTNLGNYGASWTTVDQSTWQPGKSIAWNGQNGSTGNTLQVNFNASQLKNFTIRFKYRNNSTMNSGFSISGFTDFKYNIGNGFISIPSANLALANNAIWNNEWSMDLSSLSAIEGAESVTLKWFLPDFESTGTTASQLRIDDLQITATLNANPGPLTNTSVINITKTSNNQPDGYTYPIAIEVPSGIGSPMPVAILLHGRGGNGNGAINQFRNTLDNHILVAPTGYQNSWNITDEPSDLPDIAFLRDLLTEIKTFSNVDSTRIRVVGTSNGSGMTNRVFVEIDDPGIDIICPIVSQMHQGNYRNGLFYAPSNEQNTGWSFGASKGYDTPKVPSQGRRILAITNINDASIPYAGGSKFGSDFIHSQLSAYAMAKSQGFTGSQLSENDAIELYSGIKKFSYLNEQVVHIQGSAGHSLDSNLKSILREFFNRAPPPPAPSSFIASSKSTEQVNLQWDDNSVDETGFVIQRSSNGISGWSNLKTLPPNTVISSDLNVSKGETWFYRIKATRTDSDSRWSDISSTTVHRSRSIPVSNYNVLFINIDDLKPMLGSFGDQTIITPKMDLLSSSSLNFTNAHCQQAICTASRASYLTGLRPDSTKVWDLNTHLRDVIPDVVTIPQHFRENGYNSHGIGKIFHGASASMQDVEKSFDDWQEGKSNYKYHEPNHSVMEDNRNSPLPATDKGEFLRDGVTPVNDSDYSAGVIADLTKTKLSQLKQDYIQNSKPFFLGVGFYKPHLPFTAPKNYWDLYDPDTDIDLSDYDGVKRMPSGVNLFAAPYAGEQSDYSDIDLPPTKEQARKLIHAYMACVSYVDRQVGKILDELDRLGLAESTIVVLFGDHGFHLGDHSGFWAKHSNFENATRTPLIIRVPGMEHTGNFNTPVGLIDVFPTLVDLCSLPYPKQPNGLQLEGTSLLPLIEDPTQPWKKGVFSQYQRYIWKKRNAGDLVNINHPGNGIGYSIRTERYRYTEWWRTQTTEKDSKGNFTDRDQKLFDSPEMVELYDYSVDPEETTNLIDQSNYSEIANELSTFLDGGDGWKHYAAAPSEKPAYLLNVSGNSGGSVSGGGNYEHGTSAPITATPNQGYNFDGWTGDGILERNNSSTTVSMIEARSAVASFSLKHFPLSVTAGVGGSIEGEGIFSYGSNPTIRAIPENGYSFVKWIGEGLENPLSSVTTVSMFEEREISARFVANQFNLSIISGSGGTVQGEGRYPYGSYATISATPNTGFSFVRWEGNGITDKNQSTSTVLMTENHSITAFFTEESYNLNLISGLGGTVRGEGKYPHGSIVTIHADPKTGFFFDGWTGEGVSEDSLSTTTILMTQNRSVSASFSQNFYHLDLVAQNGGSVQGAGTFAHNTDAVISAMPDEGYSFSGWQGLGISDIHEATTTVSMLNDRSVTANFELNKYELIVSSGLGGRVTGSGTYNHGETAQISAIPSIGYEFVDWKKNESTDGNLPNKSIYMNRSMSISATFQIKRYELLMISGNGGIASGSGTYDHGSVVPIHGIPEEGFVFDSWEGENIAEKNSSSTTIQIISDQNVTANFSIKEVEKNILTIRSSPTYSGTTNGSGSYDDQETITISASPMEGFSFVKWIGEGPLDSNSSTTQIYLDQDLNLTALFSLNSHHLQIEMEGNGTLSGSGIHPHGTMAEIIAVPNYGYSFQEWKGAGVMNPLSSETYVQIDRDRTLKAIFKKNKYLLKLNAELGGITKGSGIYSHGSVVPIEAIPYTGYNFNFWERNGQVENRSRSITINITDHMQWTANFQKRRVTNLGGTSHIGAEWYKSNWLGNFYQSPSIWLYHSKLGWVFPSQENESDLWLWSPQLEWLWLEKETFLKSFAWSLAESDWIFFEFKTFPSRLYHYSSGTWKDFEKDKKINLLESIF